MNLDRIKQNKILVSIDGCFPEYYLQESSSLFIFYFIVVAD